LVIDGDTVGIQGKSIRIFGIDAVELSSRGKLRVWTVNVGKFRLMRIERRLGCTLPAYCMPSSRHPMPASASISPAIGTDAGHHCSTTPFCNVGQRVEVDVISSA
jgi:hypothetical protein